MNHPDIKKANLATTGTFKTTCDAVRSGTDPVRALKKELDHTSLIIGKHSPIPYELK
jgi:hypothetical protein